MPLLTPHHNKILDVLDSEGIFPVETPSSNNKSKGAEALTRAGLSLEHVANNLKDLSYSEKEEVRMNETKTALQIHGILNEKGEKADVPQVVFIIKGNANLMNILSPRLA